MIKRAVFLDRDGTINKDVGYPGTYEAIRIYPFSFEAVRKLNQAGFITIVVTNQSGVGRGLIDEDILKDIHARMKEDFRAQNARLDGIYYCPHFVSSAHPEYNKDCSCRKPKPGMLKKAAKEHNIDLSKSWMIGDGILDIKTGQSAGCKTIFLGWMKCDLCKKMDDEKVKPDYIKQNLYKASLIIEIKERG